LASVPRCIEAATPADASTVRERIWLAVNPSASRWWVAGQASSSPGGASTGVIRSCP
jgi:hypothetical protein